MHNVDLYLKVIHARALNNHTIKPTHALTLKLHILHTICHNSDMFLSVLFVFRESLNINKALP
jgi:hypothetical protein